LLFERIIKGSGLAQLVERQASNRKVVIP